MNLSVSPDLPPTDFVAFLAQRGGVSKEAAAHRLEHWFGEYHASSRNDGSAQQTKLSDPSALSAF
jgi:hypothetical protein